MKPKTNNFNQQQNQQPTTNNQATNNQQPTTNNQLNSIIF